MKQGQPIPDILKQLQADRETRKDYIAPTQKLTMVQDPEQPGVYLAGLNGQPLGLTSLAHAQVADDLEIPKKYYERMLSEAPGLLADNVNQWLHADDRRRLVRTLRGQVRAFRSDKYRPLDNWDLMGAALPTLQRSGCQIVSANLDDRRLYVKAVLPAIQRTVHSKRGDVVQAGVVIRNSEVGDGALAVDPFAYILACLNGATFEDQRFKKHHTGKRASAEADVYELLTTEAKQADDKAFWLRVRDIVAAAFDEARFDRLVLKMNEATQATAVPVGQKIEAVIEDVTERFGFPETEADQILRQFIEGGDLSVWGLSNAITARSQQVEDYGLATAMERAGGAVIELPRSEWEAVAA